MSFFKVLGNTAKQANPNKLLQKTDYYASVGAKFGYGKKGSLTARATGGVARIGAGAVKTIENQVLSRGVQSALRGQPGAIRQAVRGVVARNITDHLGFLGNIMNAEMDKALGILDDSIDVGDVYKKSRESGIRPDEPVFGRQFEDYMTTTRKDWTDEFEKYNDQIEKRFKAIHGAMTEDLGDVQKESVEKYDKNVITPRITKLEERLQERLRGLNDNYTSLEQKVIGLDSQITENTALTDRVISNMSLSKQAQRERDFEAAAANDNVAGRIFMKKSAQDGGAISSMMSFFGNLMMGGLGKMGALGSAVASALGGVVSGLVGGSAMAGLVGLIGGILGNPITWGVILGAAGIGLSVWFGKWIYDNFDWDKTYEKVKDWFHSWLPDWLRDWLTGAPGRGMNRKGSGEQRHDQHAIDYGMLTPAEKRAVARKGLRALPPNHPARLGGVRGQSLIDAGPRVDLSGAVDEEIAASGQYHELLGKERQKRFGKELASEHMVKKIAALGQIETGGMDKGAKLKWLESFMNQSMYRDSDLLHRLNDPKYAKYWGGGTGDPSKVDEKTRKEWEDLVKQALAGSNTARMHSDNASNQPGNMLADKRISQGREGFWTGGGRNQGEFIYTDKHYEKRRAEWMKRLSGSDRGQFKGMSQEQARALMRIDPTTIVDPNDPIGSLRNQRRVARTTDRDFYVDGQSPFNYANTREGRAEMGAPGDYRNQTQITLKNGMKFTTNKAIAHRVRGMMNEALDRGYNLDHISSYNPRNKRGGRSLSMHAWGGAFDINPGANPFRGGGRTDMPPAMRLLAKKWGFAQLSSDRMHFENVPMRHRQAYAMELLRTGVVKPDDPIVKELYLKQGWVTEEQLSQFSPKGPGQIPAEQRVKPVTPFEVGKPKTPFGGIPGSKESMVNAYIAANEKETRDAEFKKQGEKLLGQWSHKQATALKSDEAGKHIPTQGPQPMLVLPKSDKNPDDLKPPPAAAPPKDKGEEPRDGKFGDKPKPTTEVKKPNSYGPEYADASYGSTGFGPKSEGGGGNCFI